MTASCLAWLHVGDLHASAADGWAGPERLQSLLTEAREALSPGEVDLVMLPGDNADDGAPEQYARVQAALEAARFPAPVALLPGDHDFKEADLDAFRAFGRAVGASVAPFSLKLGGRRVVGLDVVEAAAGGPSFALGEPQRLWLRRELQQAEEEDALPPVVMMHAFPGDLAEEGPELASLFAKRRVALVDTGHTHYNELLNDGEVVYAAVRSTAQIEEEGAEAFGVGFVAVDGGEASFRFRRHGSGWPLVMITSPADQRLAVRTAPLDGEGRLVVRAKVFGAGGEARVTLHVGDEPPVAMHPAEGETALWTGALPGDWRARLAALEPPQRRFTVRVAAECAAGRGEDVIRIAHRVRRPAASGAGFGGGAVGAWPEHGLLGTRLGPNAYGRG